MGISKLLIAGLLLSCVSSLEAAPRTEAKAPSPALKAARTALEAGAKEDASTATARYREAAAQIQKLAPANVLVQNGLATALKQARAAKDDVAASRILRDGLKEVARVLSFKVRKEADMPEHWPEPTPLGEIQLKHYPAYRLARSQSSSSTAAFFTLFDHISKKDIAMTAPVEMTFEAKKGGKLKQKDMAFLYGSARTGKLGKDGRVEVLDLPALDTVSIGLNGGREQERLAEARALLEKWLKEHADKYEVCGPLRVMGYNSPAVPPKESFIEIELPVRLKKAAR